MFPVPYEQFASSVFYYERPYSFERDFHEHEAFQWMRENWTISIWLSLIYVAAILEGRRFMATRSKYDLRPWLAAWSGLLAAFSIFSAVRLIPPILYTIYYQGFDYLTCYPPIYFGDTGFYGWVFTLSKAVELGDTAFIVLRKKPLLFLHWYHHVTVLIYSFYTYAWYYAPGQWFVPMNLFVHSLMYTYYCLSALQVRIPRKVNICITTIQLSQMLFGVYVNIRAFMLMSSGQTCQLEYDHLAYSMAMYGTYAMLFAHYFYKAYLSPRKTGNTSGTVRCEMNGVNGIHAMQNGVNHMKTQ